LTYFTDVMKEFGSDYHYLPVESKPAATIHDFYPDANYYADGRQALAHLYKSAGWKRLWVPTYFCYDVLKSISSQGVNLAFYHDNALNDTDSELISLPFTSGDALLRVNYFGLRGVKHNGAIPVPVVEDHTHDLIGPWATNSDADWCIASLRKTLPLAEGGILWSPCGKRLPEKPIVTQFNKELARRRWASMKMKSLYLKGKIQDKNVFRLDMTQTEKMFDTMAMSAIDDETGRYLENFDVMSWYEGKKANWKWLKENIDSNLFTVLEPEDSRCTPFSLTLLLKDETTRNNFRNYLIENNVFPAILWTVPDNVSTDVIDFSRKMLSIHCDSRYSGDAISALCQIIVGC